LEVVRAGIWLTIVVGAVSGRAAELAEKHARS
jgi:hypothetical protein